MMRAMEETAGPLRHSLTEDAQGLFTGTLVVALALLLLRQAGLVTGGTAGAALVLHYALGVPFGLAFFTINLPFYALAWHRMGRAFTLKTLTAVALMALLSEALPRLITLQAIDPTFAAIGGGVLAGVGLLILFRHRASLGGMNVLVLWLQERRGWRAGRTQGVIDVAILLASSPWLNARQLVLSVAGALALNFVLAINHRPDRYVAL
jgi:uncharacterized membrane-anchored protein YitT (DUF2179 family)